MDLLPGRPLVDAHHGHPDRPRRVAYRQLDVAVRGRQVVPPHATPHHVQQRAPDVAGEGLLPAELEERLQVARALLAGGHRGLALGRAPLRVGHLVQLLAPLAQQPLEEGHDLVLVAELVERHLLLLAGPLGRAELGLGRHDHGLGAHDLDVAEEVVGLPLPDLGGVDVRDRGGVLERVVEAAEARGVVLAEERGRLAQQTQAPDHLLPRERQLPRTVRSVFGLRHVGDDGGR
uniref:Uncharacterized protein n=1 Tax=Triticum urartu TaxID=4572 RepID=A0A8R7P1G2_TRIUA